jgi:hypothetical protein
MSLSGRGLVVGSYVLSRRGLELCALRVGVGGSHLWPSGRVLVVAVMSLSCGLVVGSYVPFW